MKLLHVIFTVALCVSAPVLLAEPLAAKNRALLIGVSKYQLSKELELKAPGNDVRLIFDALTERGFAREDMVVLTDNLGSGQEAPARVDQPTAENIVRELNALGDSATEGDVIVIYFSGHGSSGRLRQSTRLPGDFIEADGWHEAILAIDTQRYDPIRNEWKGVVLDRTLKRSVDAIRKKNAFVWLILDACHAGGLTRDASIGVSVRFVEPDLLNLPRSLQSSSAAAVTEVAKNPWISRQGGGSQVAFLAAPEDHPAFEREISEAGGSHYGLFTYTLVKVLKAENFSSYRQLARAVVHAQAAVSANVPSPVFDGDLDRQMFEGTPDGPRRWSARIDGTSGNVHVEAGALHGVRGGTILSFARDSRLVGFGKVVQAGVSTSRAQLIEHNAAQRATSDALMGSLSATVVQPAVSFSLKVARPPLSDKAGNKLAQIGLKAIDSLSAEPKPSLPIEWVEPRDRSADIHLRILEGVIYLVSASGELVLQGRARTAAVVIQSDVASTAGELRENLWRALRRQNLFRIAQEMRRTELDAAVEVRLKLIRDTDELKRVVLNERQPCRSWNTAADAAPSQPIPQGGIGYTRLTHCDRVGIEIFNKRHKAVDVTLLYLDGEGGIALLENGEIRIPAKQAHRSQHFEPVRIITWCDRKIWDLCKGVARSGLQSIGKEHLMIIVAEAGEKVQDLRTFGFLQQPTLSRAEEENAKPATRNADGFEALLRNAALVQDHTRNVDPTGDATIKIYSFDVLEPSRFMRRR